MKETELRPGDYVKVLIDPNTNKQEIGKVTGYNGALLFQIDGFSWVHICRLAPIPITPEILEKNGWEDDSILYDWQYKEKLYLTVSYTGKKKHRKIDSIEVYSNFCNSDGDMSQYYLRSITAVHELQHLLWALGIDDDLKI